MVGANFSIINIVYMIQVYTKGRDGGLGGGRRHQLYTRINKKINMFLLTLAISRFLVPFNLGHILQLLLFFQIGKVCCHGKLRAFYLPARNVNVYF